jgi:hypothetical protein
MTASVMPKRSPVFINNEANLAGQLSLTFNNLYKLSAKNFPPT